MDRCHTYGEPVAGLMGLTDFTDRWKTTQDSFREGRFRETVLNFLDYLSPGVTEKHRTGEDEFSIPHGSLVISVKIADGLLSVDAPFLHVPEKRVNPLLRKVSEINFSVLYLTQIVLVEDRLHFSVEVPLELCEPYKLYDIFYEICINADYYDDLFMEKFQALRVTEPRVTLYSTEELEGFFTSFTEHLTEAMDFLEYCRDKRWFDLGLETGIISLTKIDYVFAPQGYLRTGIENTWSSCCGNAQPSDKVEILLDFSRELRSMTLEEFSRSVYRTEFLVSVRKHAFLPDVKESLQGRYQNAGRDISSSAFLGAAVSLMYGIYTMLYRFLVPVSIEEILNQGLMKASGQNWETAAKELYAAVAKVMEMEQHEG